MVSFRTFASALLATFLVAAAPASAGNGSFAAGKRTPVGYPLSLAVGDFNSDSRPDVAAMDYEDHYVAVLLSKPGGGFTDAGHVVVGTNPTQVAVGDFDADGNDDLAVSSADDKKVTVRLGKGDGSFKDAPDLSFTYPVMAVAVGDFDANGKDDLAISEDGNTGNTDYHIRVRISAGDGTFTAGGTEDVRANALAVGDFNGDALEDIAYGGPAGSPSGVLIGTGGGPFADGAEIPLPGPTTGARTLAVGDFNRDGRLDVAAAVATKGVVAVRLGDGNGFPSGEDIRVGEGTYGLAAGDFNSDGNLDLVATIFGKNAFRVLTADGRGGFNAGAPVATGKSPQDVVAGDFDGNGNDDLAVDESLFAGSITVHSGLGKPALAGSLLVNGGFEAPQTQAELVPGWKLTGGTGTLRYGSVSHAYLPSWSAAPGFATGGGQVLWGGDSSSTNGVTTASQTVGVGRSAKLIDSGHARAGLSAYLGGSLFYGDRMGARAEFLGANGKPRGALKIGPVTASGRNKLTTMLRRAASGRVPVGTRRIRVTLTSIDDDKTLSGAVADNVKLTLDARRAFRKDAQVSFSRLETEDANASVPIVVANGNPFRVKGTVTARTVKRLGPNRKHLKLDPAALRVRAGGSQIVHLVLPRAARRELVNNNVLALRLTAVVHDAAGHKRTLRPTLRIVRE